MSPSPQKRVKLTPETLARMKEDAATRRARHEAAFLRAASAPPPPEAVRSEPERVLRALALGLAALAAFVPAALFTDGHGEVVALGPAVRNLAFVLLLTLGPAVLSARAERAPEAEDAPSSRFARRFSPLAVGVLLFLSLLMAHMGWPAVETALVAQALVGLSLHVPRARACHIFCVLWGAAASATLDERASAGLAVAFALVVLAAVLDRALDVRVALGVHAPPVRLAPLLVATGVVLAAFAALAAPALWLLRDVELQLPRAEPTRLTRPLEEASQASAADLLVALAVIVLALAAYHLLFGRLERREEPGGDEEEAPPPPAVVERLHADAPVDVGAWPAGPRRALVERYLEHLSRLRRLGAPREPAQAPLDVADAVGERAPGLLERARRLARAFQRARYSPAPVPGEAVDEASRDAAEIEGALAESRRT